MAETSVASSRAPIPPKVAAQIQAHRDLHAKRGGGPVQVAAADLAAPAGAAGGLSGATAPTGAPAPAPATTGVATPPPASRGPQEARPAEAAKPEAPEAGKDGKSAEQKPVDGKEGDKADAMFDGKPLSNPFDVPAVQLQIETLALPAVQALAQAQSQNCARDYEEAVNNVCKAESEKAEAAQQKREQMTSLLLTIALMPAGPLVSAAARIIDVKVVQDAVEKALVENAGKLQQSLGARGAAFANKAFDLVASEQADKLVAKFSPEKAKAALEAGVDKLKETSVEFLASTDTKACIESFCKALKKAANDSMHNLTDAIGGTKTFSEAAAYYNMFKLPLQASYEAAVTAQVQHMLRQAKSVLATDSKPQVTPIPRVGNRTTTEEIVWVKRQGGKMLAYVTRKELGTMAGHTKVYEFKAWITPDIRATVESKVKEEVDLKDLDGWENVPEPEHDTGERVVRVLVGDKERLMLISIEDDKGTFSTDYGVQTFKQWANGEEQERAFMTRGASQIGGVNTVDIETIRKVPPL